MMARSKHAGRKPAPIFNDYIVDDMKSATPLYSPHVPPLPPLPPTLHLFSFKCIHTLRLLEKLQSFANNP